MNPEFEARGLERKLGATGGVHSLTIDDIHHLRDYARKHTIDAGSFVIQCQIDSPRAFILARRAPTLDARLLLLCE